MNWFKPKYVNRLKLWRYNQGLPSGETGKTEAPYAVEFKAIFPVSTGWGYHYKAPGLHEGNAPSHLLGSQRRLSARPRAVGINQHPSKMMIPSEVWASTGKHSTLPGPPYTTFFGESNMAIEKKMNHPVVGDAFSVDCAPGQPHDYDLERKFKEMAENDMRVNGSYLNQPYKVIHDGLVHKARVRVRKVVESLVLQVENPQHFNSPRVDPLMNIDLKCDRTIEIK